MRSTTLSGVKVHARGVGDVLHCPPVDGVHAFLHDGAVAHVRGRGLVEQRDVGGGAIGHGDDVAVDRQRRFEGRGERRARRRVEVGGERAGVGVGAIDVVGQLDHPGLDDWVPQGGSRENDDTSGDERL